MGDSHETREDPDYLSTKLKIRTSDLKEAKTRREKWAMLTSYDAISAKIFDVAKIPCLLIGDSAAQAVYGHKSTIPITMDQMVPLARAVASSCERALVIADMPFGSYQASPEVALQNATRFMKESLVHGVKLEGGKEYIDHVRLLTRSGIPVMAHIGFTPQSEHSLGGIKIQGRDCNAANRLLVDALALEEAGAFACVLEMVPADVGRLITRDLKIPTVGIGAGPDCDAQILVWTDMVGFTAPKGKIGGYLKGSSETSESSGQNGKPHSLELNRVPKFVKKYANLSEIIFDAVREYANDVKTGIYPSEEHCYK